MSAAYPAAAIATELGFAVLSDDVPRVVSAIHGAYSAGLRDASHRVLWGFFHTTCVFESAAGLVSLHRSKAGAWRAMHRAQWAAWEALRAEQRTPRRWRVGLGSVRGRKVYEHERSFVRAAEVLP